MSAVYRDQSKLKRSPIRPMVGRVARVDAGDDGRRVRVCHLTSSHDAGDVRILWRECRTIARDGRYEVTLAAHGRTTVPRGVLYRSLGSMPVRRSARFTLGVARAARFALANEFDIWHIHDPELVPLAILMSRTGRVVIWDAHEDYVNQFDSIGSKAWVPRPLRRLVRAGLEVALRLADDSAEGVVAATASIARRYRNSRTVLVGNEAMVEDFADSRPMVNNRTALFTGTVSDAYLFTEVVDAVASIPGMTLSVAGREPQRSAWDHAERRLPGRLAYLGWLDRTDLALAFSKASVGLATYTPSAADSDETVSPTKVFEFAAAGLPVLASPIPSCARLVGEGHFGVVCRDFTSAAIAQGLSEVHASPERWSTMSQNARAWASNTGSWATSASALLSLYADVAPMEEVDDGALLARHDRESRPSAGRRDT